MMQKINISLTSYPARIETVARALQPILHQTVAPDRVLLWLSQEEFPDFERSLPQNILELQATHEELQIRWVQGNHFSHDKYLHCLREFPEDITILIDDDLIYSTTLVQGLLDAHFVFPESIIANRTHLITCNEAGEIAPYAEWAHEQTEFIGSPRNDLLATTGAGTLYPPHVFDETAFDIDAIEKMARTADDIWLMMCTINAHRTVVSIGKPNLNYIDGTQENGLCKVNWDQGQNDVWLKMLFNQYPDFHTQLLEAVARRIATTKKETPQKPRGLFKHLKK